MKRSIFYGAFEHRTAGGIILLQRTGLPNLLHDEGEEAILSAYFDTDLAGFGAPPANLYLGLRSNAPAEADTLAAGLTELTGTGYGRIALSTVTDHTLSQVSGDWRAVSAQKTFQNSGVVDWPGATHMFVCTVAAGAAGKLISSVALSSTRILKPTDLLTCSYYVGLSE